MSETAYRWLAIGMSAAGWIVATIVIIWKV